MLSNNSRFLRYATYNTQALARSFSFFPFTSLPLSLSPFHAIILTPASTLAGLEQFGSANSETIEISTPVKMPKIESHASLSFCYTLLILTFDRLIPNKSHGMDVWMWISRALHSLISLSLFLPVLDSIVPKANRPCSITPIRCNHALTILTSAFSPLTGSSPGGCKIEIHNRPSG